MTQSDIESRRWVSMASFADWRAENLAGRLHVASVRAFWFALLKAYR